MRHRTAGTTAKFCARPASRGLSTFTPTSMAPAGSLDTSVAIPRLRLAICWVASRTGRRRVASTSRIAKAGVRGVVDTTGPPQQTRIRLRSFREYSVETDSANRGRFCFVRAHVDGRDRARTYLRPANTGRTLPHVPQGSAGTSARGDPNVTRYGGIRRRMRPTLARKCFRAETLFWQASDSPRVGTLLMDHFHLSGQRHQAGAARAAGPRRRGRNSRLRSSGGSYWQPGATFWFALRQHDRAIGSSIFSGEAGRLLVDRIVRRREQEKWQADRRFL